MSKNLLKIYGEWISDLGDIVTDTPESLYSAALDLISGVSFNLNDVVAFSHDKKESHRMDLGLFISAAINRTIKDNETIKLLIWPWTRYLGAFMERGTMIIKPGNPESGFHACYQFGYHMQGGKIVIEDNTSVDMGFGMTGGHIVSIGDFTIADAYNYGDDRGFGRRMGGGKIRLEGNLENYRAPRGMGPFSEMSGGDVEILGNVRSNVSFIGHKMTDGTVRIQGDCDDVGEGMLGGLVKVEGNARDVGHYMHGGMIHVECDVKWVGSEMDGGKIVVDGNCKNSVGKSMRGSSEIHVKKDAGDVGREMNGGHILIDGDVLGEIGCEMRGGKIHVRGSNLEKERSIGLCMRNGEITIEGDALSGAGDRMKGGIIHVNGSMKQTNYVRYGGQVYHRGQVVRDSLSAKFIKWTQKFFDRPGF